MQLSQTALSQMADILGRVDEGTALAERLAELRSLEDELRSALDGDIGSWLGTIPGGAREAAEHLFDAGGKRLRPVLALLSGGAAGGEARSALPVAAAVELLHTGTLLHDDVVDEGDVRRGRPTARRVWGNALAVLAGDFCYFASLDALVDHGDQDILRRAMRVARALCEGELAQLQRRGTGKLGGEAAYFEVIENKTASIFSFATWGGARCAGADPDVASALDEFGHKIGLAFQIVDDVLDFSGDPEVFGKALGQDVVEGTVTLPLAYATEGDAQLAADVRRFVTGFASGSGEAPDARRIVERVRGSGALARSSERAAALTREAIVALEKVPASRYRRALELLAASLLDRAS